MTTEMASNSPEPPLPPQLGGSQRKDHKLPAESISLPQKTLIGQLGSHAQ